MPTYEYACRGCGEHLEAVQSFQDEPLTTCPSCGGSLRKVFGAVGITFKGSGFYKTDSRGSSSASRRSESSDGSGSSSDGGSADGGSSTPEAKPAAASTPASPAAPAKTEGSTSAA